MPGSCHDELKERALCERFLDLAKKGDRGPDYSAALAGLYPLITRRVEKIFRKWTGLSPGLLEAGDVAHEVFLRLQNSPPTKEPTHNARVTVLKWITVCAARYLTDLTRKCSFSFRTVRTDPNELERMSDARQETHNSGGGCTNHNEQRIADRELLAELENYLRVHYPRGAEYLEALRSNPGATPEELAHILGTTKQNVYQIRSRLTARAVKWLEGISS